MIFFEKAKSNINFGRKRDNPVVFVKNNNIETAIRILRRKVELAGNHKALNIRRKYPSRKDRRRVKDRKARQRFMHDKSGIKKVSV